MDGYYNSLLSFIDKAVEEGFISPNARHIIVSAPSSKELVKKLEVREKGDIQSQFLFFVRVLLEVVLCVEKMHVLFAIAGVCSFS